MSKTKSLEALNEYLVKYKQAFELCKVDSIYQIPDLSKVHPNYIKDAVDWFQSLELLFQNWRKIRKQQSEERWARYLVDPGMFEGFHEVILHKKAIQELRLQLNIKSRPLIFHKKKHESLGEYK